jgi:hypothetical protein
MERAAIRDYKRSARLRHALAGDSHPMALMATPISLDESVNLDLNG